MLVIYPHLVGCAVVVMRHVPIAAYFDEDIVIRKKEIGTVLMLIEKDQWFVYKSDILRVQIIGAPFLIARSDLRTRLRVELCLEFPFTREPYTARRMRHSCLLKSLAIMHHISI